MNTPLYALVLAAGQGTRMRSSRPKVLFPLGGRTLLDHVLSTLPPLAVSAVSIVVGHQAQAVEAAVRTSPHALTDLRFALQPEQKGTADAVRCGLEKLPELAARGGKVLILYGDTPLLTTETLQRLLSATTGKLGLLTTTLLDPTGYGRIVRQDGHVHRIVEHKDATPAERALCEVNAGMYLCDAQFLLSALRHITQSPATRELYLTHLFEIAGNQGETITAVTAAPDEVFGVNDRADLAQACDKLRARTNRAHMLAGVTFVDPATTHVDVTVEIGPDTELWGGVCLRGQTRIGPGCVLEQGCVLENVLVQAGTHIRPYTVAKDSHIGSRCHLGPFSHLRPGSVLSEDAHVGNFVELKKTHLGQGSKANHLTYLGDAQIGANVNIGCGTITCNYDGFAKHPTLIEDGVFIGSDTQLVAPVRVGKDAIIAAGTTVTHDVPEGALAVSRVPQKDKPGAAKLLRTRFAARKAKTP
jgi:bifunctional UDP-N-acetylglucosamine pyrophosphorylase/glucosamine-1-phosphate N-acetyltransferase